jgi:hypothetical protein
MEQTSERLDQVAHAVREAGNELRGQQPQLASVAETAAERVEDVSRYLRQHDLRDVIQEAESWAHRQPAIVIAGGLALGIALGRVLRTADGGMTGDGGERDRGWSGDTGKGIADAGDRGRSTRDITSGVGSMDVTALDDTGRGTGLTGPTAGGV